MIEGPVVDLLRDVGVEDGAEGEAVIPAGGEVGDVDLRVADGLVLAPLEQGVALRAAPLGQHRQGVLLIASQLSRN